MPRQIEKVIPCLARSRRDAFDLLRVRRGPHFSHAALLQSPDNRGLEFHNVTRLEEIIRSAQAHRLNRRIERAVAGKDEGNRAWRDLLQPAQDTKAVIGAKTQVQQRDVKLGGVD